MVARQVGRIKVLELGFTAGSEPNFCIFCVFCNPVKAEPR